MSQVNDTLQQQWIKQLKACQAKKMTTIELQQLLKIENYRLFANEIKQLEEQGVLKGIKVRETNGMNPPLCRQYEVLINKVKKQTLDYRQELQRLHPKISTTHYEKHQKHYETYREQIERLSGFLKDCAEQERNQIEISYVSVNERSFELFYNEKTLDQLIKRGVIENLGLTLDDLYVYQTDESFFYFPTGQAQGPANVLIIENKDTYFTLQRLFQQSGQRQSLNLNGIDIHALIYGEGRKIEKSLIFTLDHVEPIFKDTQTTYYYIGDLDYPGIAIYLNLYTNYQHTHRLTYFPNYFDLLIQTFKEKTKEVSTSIPWPSLKDKDRKHQPFELDQCRLFIPNQDWQVIEEQLATGHYLPQEVMSYVDWKQQLKPVEVSSCFNKINMN